MPGTKNDKDTQRQHHDQTLTFEQVKELLREGTGEAKNFVGGMWKNVASMSAVSVISFCLIYGAYRTFNFFDNMLGGNTKAIESVAVEIKGLREEVKIDQRHTRDDMAEFRKIMGYMSEKISTMK